MSIGTGVPTVQAFGDSLREIGKTLLAISTETEKTAETFARHYTNLDDGGRYYRFNVLQGLEKIGLEEASKRGAIMAATKRYLASERVHKELKKCGELLETRECWFTCA